MRAALAGLASLGFGAACQGQSETSRIYCGPDSEVYRSVDTLRSATGDTLYIVRTTDSIRCTVAPALPLIVDDTL